MRIYRRKAEIRFLAAVLVSIFFSVAPQVSIPGNAQGPAVREITCLVRVDHLDPTIVIEMRYATDNNFTGKQIYPVHVCVLHKGTAAKLIAAHSRVKKDGYRLKVWDAYRPPHVQRIFWDLVRDERYVRNPAKGGSKHSTGGAVDVTLVDSEGRELEMPTLFDEFSERAWRSNDSWSIEARENSDYLTKAMTEAGFEPIREEWWHFEDSDAAKYSPVDVKLEWFVAIPESIS